MRSGRGASGPLSAAARCYMHETGATEEDFAFAAVRNRRNALGSPVAAFGKPVTVEDVLRSRCLSSPIKLLDSAASLDGAAAVVVVSEEMARDLSPQPLSGMPGGRSVLGGIEREGISLQLDGAFFRPARIRRPFLPGIG